MLSQNKSTRTCRNNFGYLKVVFTLAVLVACFCVSVRAQQSEETGFVDADGEQVERYQIAKFNYQYVGAIYPIVLWVLLGSLAKLG